MQIAQVSFFEHFSCCIPLMVIHLNSFLQLQDNFAVDSYEWWMGLSADISELASNIQGLSELTGLMDDFSSMDITNLTDSELLSTIQRLLIDNGPDSLIDR